MALADARAQIPHLAAVDADPVADAALLEKLAAYCQCYTPRVAIDPPLGLILDITGATHRFAPEPQHAEQLLAHDLAQRLSVMGFAVRWALAHAPMAAAALARFGYDEHQLGQLPVTALRTDGKIHHALRRAGLTRISDLATRPRAILAARFGKAMTMQLAQLLGEEDAPITPIVADPPIRIAVRLAEPIGHIDAVKVIVSDLAGQAVAQLAARGMGARALTASLFRCDGEVTILPIETATPTRDAGLIMRLFDERISALNDPLDPGFGYDTVMLAITGAEMLKADQSGWLDGGRGSGEIAALLARLGTRLGRTRITRFAVRDTHIPEAASYEVSALGAVPPGNISGAPLSETEPPAEPAHRPLLMLDPPQPITVLAEVPDGPPYRFRWRGSLHQVLRHEGPERIALPWWRGDGYDQLTRDYYRVEDDQGHRFWLFRHGLYSEKPDPDWYVHGLFA